MAKSYPPRPEQDFSITVFAWQMDNEATHRRAGFPAISPETLTRRFWQFLSFIQAQGFTTHVVASCPAAITAETELRNSDLTDEGYRFVQRYCDRWNARMHKDTGETREAKYLVKWLNQLRTESVGA
jgi:aminoglycoside phosphotransferase (APT) family kinase protein